MKQYDPDAVVRAERETWNRFAPAYYDNATPFTSHAVDLLIKSAGLGPGSRGLEVGCGPGHITKRMADTGATMIGVDLAPAMIDVARRRYPGIEFREGDSENLPFDAEVFDAVLVNFAIHHFARPQKACADIHRVLKRGGRFVFAGPIEQIGFSTFIEALTAHHTMDVLAHGPIYLGATKEDYENLVKGAGFRAYDITVRRLPLRLETLQPLFGTGWGICELSKLPQATQDKIRQTTMEKAAPYKTGGGYEFPDRIVVGLATK